MAKFDFNKIKERVNPLVVAGFAVGIIIIVILVVVLRDLLRTNPYGDETRIDNLTAYYDNLPQNEKDLIFHQLHSIISNNMSGEVPTDGALVREGTAEYDYDKMTRTYYGKFIVDIAAIEQSYSVQFEWSKDGDKDESLGGYPVMISCVPKAKQIYSGFKCNDFSQKMVSWQNEYQLDYTFGEKTSYRVTEALGNYWLKKIDEIVIDAVLDETSLKQLSMGQDLIFQFKVVVNEKSIYTITVKMDELYGEQYIAIYMSGDNSAGFVMAKDGSMISSLSNWVKEYSGNQEIEISTLDY